MNVFRLLLVATGLFAVCAAAASVEFTDCTPFIDQHHRGTGHRFTAQWSLGSDGYLDATIRPAEGEAQASLAFVRTLQVLHLNGNDNAHLASTVEFQLDPEHEFTEARAPIMPSGSYKAYARMHDGNGVVACAEFSV